MDKIGVEAVVSGLSSFLGGMGKMDDSIRKLISPTNILGSAFDALGNFATSAGNFIANTLAHALGEILADAVQWVTTQIKELITATIEAGNEFQTLELRLNTLNFNDLTEDEKKFSNAQELAIEKTKEQLSWLQKIAAQTPYDNTDISNVYTLARGYGFIDDEARDLTETIIDFTSGMGLGNTEIVRIIKNFGQMRQLGKLTQRDLNDLATGAFVPVNDILAKMRVETGLAGKEFDDFRVTGEGVELFMSTFAEMVDKDFGGSAQKMARTFGAATDNMKDFIKSVVGLNIVKPILDVLGGRLASFMDELTSEARWDTIVGLADRIGSSLSGIVEDIMGLSPSATGMADGIVNGFTKIADWIDAHRTDIVDWVKDIAAWITDTAVPAVQDLWKWLFGSGDKKGAIQEFGEWLEFTLVPFIKSQVLPVIDDIFEALSGKSGDGDLMTGFGDIENTPLQKILEIVKALSEAVPPTMDLLRAFGDVIIAAFGGDESQTVAEFIRNTLIPAIEDLTKFVDDNREGFANLLKAIVALEVLAFIIQLFFSFLLGISSLMVAFGMLFVPLGMFLSLLSSIFTAFNWLSALLMTSIPAAFGIFIAGVVGLIAQLKFLEFGLRSLVGGVKIVVDSVISGWQSVYAHTVQVITDVLAKIRSGDWVGAGRAIITGLIQGVSNSASMFINMISALARNAVAAAKATLGIRSPSTVFFGIGEQLMAGFAEGITESAGLAVRAMTSASQALMIPAMQGAQMAYSMAAMPASSISNQTTNNYSLQVNTSAPSEPIIQDFNMLSSLAA